MYLPIGLVDNGKRGAIPTQVIDKVKTLEREASEPRQAIEMNRPGFVGGSNS